MRVHVHLPEALENMQRGVHRRHLLVEVGGGRQVGHGLGLDEHQVGGLGVHERLQQRGAVEAEVVGHHLRAHAHARQHVRAHQSLRRRRHPHRAHPALLQHTERQQLP